MGRSPTLPWLAREDQVLTTFPVTILKKLKEITETTGTCPLLQLGLLLTTRMYLGKFSSLFKHEQKKS